MLDVALATCRSWPDLGPLDRDLLSVLRARGLKVAPVIWSEPAPAAAAILIQSTWDYTETPGAFLAWARAAARTGRLLNPLPLIEWNLHKGYLEELEAGGVPVTPTRWVRKGEAVALAGVMQTQGWPACVIKPAVAASARGVRIVDEADIAAGQAWLDELLVDQDVLVQPYLRTFETEGERSYIFFDGVFSHAIRRPPTLAGADRGFSEPSLMVPGPGEVELSQATLSILPEVPLYARVDVATDNDGRPRLQELELIEPCLFTAFAPGSVDTFADAVIRRLKD